MQALPLAAQGQVPQIVKDNMDRAKMQKIEKCYAINAAAKNDCAEGALNGDRRATANRPHRQSPGRRTP